MLEDHCKKGKQTGYECGGTEVQVFTKLHYAHSSTKNQPFFTVCRSTEPAECQNSKFVCIFTDI